VNGARWAQHDLLDTHPRLDVRVYAIWFSMYPTDARARWPAPLLTDERVTHRWDERRLVGGWYWDELPWIWARKAPESLVPQAGPVWDAYFLYAREAAWDDRPTHLVSWGYTIMRSRAALLRELDRLASAVAQE
jgi:hypothetical protein